MNSQHKCNHQQICQHRHYYKCPKQAVKKISHLFPKRKLQVQTNRVIKSTRNYTSNIPTLAYQKYIDQQLEIYDDQNYVRDYYINAESQNKKSIDIIKLTEQHLQSSNAYVLSDMERQKFKQKQRSISLSVNKTKKRAVSVYNNFLNNNRQNDKQLKIETQKEMKKLYAALDEIANNIIYGNITKKIDRQKDFLLSKSYLNAHYLSQLKIRNPKNTLDLLQEIRVLLQKEKLRYEEQRIILDGNQSKEMSFSMQSSQSGDTSQSKISQTSMISTQASGQEQFINKFCDIKQLQKKWKKQTIEQAKNLIRKILSHKLLSQAQRKIIQNRNKQSQMQKKLKLLTSGNEKSKKAKNEKKNPRTIIAQNNRKSIIESIQQKQNIALNYTLNQQEQQTKKQFLKTGRFDHPAKLFDKTTCYSRIFDKTTQQLKMNLSLLDVQTTFNSTRKPSFKK